MSPGATLATAARLARQLSHDHRTIAMLLLLPTLLLVLFRFVFDENIATFNAVGGAMLAIFPFVTMFLVTSITTLRERTGGTLERLLTMPIHKIDLLLGYALTFGFIAIIQVAIATLAATSWLGLDIQGELHWLFAVAALDALLGVALGLFVSAFAKTEFQAVQFMPLFVLPQFLLSGLLVPREDMHPWLYEFSKILPLSYAVDAVNAVARESSVSDDFYRNVATIALITIGLLILGALTLRCKTR